MNPLADLAKTAFEHAYAVTAAVNTEGTDWDPAYTLKELGVAYRELAERVEAIDVQRQYELGLRIYALGALYLSKLLTAPENVE